MRISITCEKPGWILYRMAEELKRRLDRHEVFINEKVRDADIRYYINYGYYRKKSDTVDMGWFTHFDPDNLSDMWLRAAAELDHCVAQSEVTKQCLTSQGVPEEKITVIICGADESFVPKVRVGVVGRVYKGGRKGEHLVKRLSEDAEVASVVSLVARHEGWSIPVNELGPHDFYNSLDFLLIPSLLEGGPIPFFEALASGKQVIAPPIGNIPQFEHLEYKTGDYDDMKRALLAACAPVYEERSRRASQVKKYNWEHWAAEHGKLFEKLYEKRKAKGKSGLSRLWSR